MVSKKSENAGESRPISNMHHFISSTDTMTEIGQITKVGKNDSLKVVIFISVYHKSGSKQCEEGQQIKTNEVEIAHHASLNPQLCWKITVQCSLERKK